MNSDTIPGVTRFARDRMAHHHGRDFSRGRWLAAVMAILDRSALLVATRTGPNGRTEEWLVEVDMLRRHLVWSPRDAVVINVMPGSDFQAFAVIPRSGPPLEGSEHAELA
ncbi:hypothetical protein [Rhodovarius lipocyclicus]|uniref:hypothetical protein n=1 Tax=Rhodovarius lipocyclicus TaxID=268410 RepID=UPI00135BBA1E|nr:hypothetical protein [Rhodovarius lipocyclicus]